MAKNALGRGLGALLNENSVDTAAVLNPTAAAEPVSRPVAAAATTAKPSKIPSCIEVDENGGLWIDPALLKPNPKQPRVDFDQKKLEELAESIANNGILEPIIIEQITDTEFYIIAGERRTRASRMAGLSKVPVQLRKFDEQQKLELALIENIQRADLNPIEEATAYYNLIQMSDLSQDEVAKKVGKNRSTVANAIRLLKLPADIQKALVSGQISSGHARALLMVKNDADMHIMFGKIIGSGLSVREAEAMAEVYNNGGRAVAKKKDKKKSKKDPDVAIFEQELKNLFGVKDVELKGTTEKGSLEIGFSSSADFQRIYDILLGEK
ncbi:MAG: ParB/RepB/Spo0J family partition protein [Treponema sp.]|nr:ParB/RepB/Spo0J family partition protein [Treponema sp.]